MKHADIVGKMTLEEKAALMGGKGEWDSYDLPRVGVPSMIMSDGPHGIRRQAGAGDHLGLNESLPATCFPTAATMANSWDPELGEKVGEALGEEAMAEGVNVLLGPGMNIKRSPLCGRNFEYFSEDPYLAGKMAASYVRGIQSKGVSSCVKHFAVNSQEERRQAMNAVIDERTLREIYLTGFEIAVKEGKAKAIMSSYNQINGVYAHENKHLLSDILRDDWGFEGAVISDWGGSNEAVAAIEAGGNLEMPAPGLSSARQIVEAVNRGELPEEILDKRVDELLDLILSTTNAAKGHSDKFDINGHHELAKKAAGECAVLLKNEENILPLKKGTKVAVIGDFAFVPRYQGAGSSVVNKTKLDTIENLINNEDLEIVGMSRGYQRVDGPDSALEAEALELASKSDVVLFFFGLDEISESEGLDRKHMRLPRNQIALINALSKKNSNIIGIISAGSSVVMDWETSFKALLHCYLTGQAGAGAVLDILMGRINPSGKLAETFPIGLEDTSSYNYYPAKQRNTDYRESIYIGYRYFDKAGKKVKYPFGYGLSYTTFEYSDIKVDEKGATFTVKNTGAVSGAEIAQMYVSLPDAKVFRPVKELKGFAKIKLEAGESKTVTIPFDEYTFRYWNVKKNGWSEESGAYEIKIGGCSDKLSLGATIVRSGSSDELPYNEKDLPSYYKGSVEKVSDSEYEKLLGRPIPDGSWSGQLGPNDAICQLSYAKSGLARMIYKRLEKMKKESEERGKPDLNILFIYNMPFRATAKMTGGMVDKRMVEGMVMVVNGHFFKGVGRLIGGYFKNKSANKKYLKNLRGE
ncbi:MAG: glycoside hydrolase family 3 C-terminal domain-containing protein [Lachnospiraceae bacterium]|nr:glycoside hydrolase family 3 C-terminal domain-containing protein [Lachnospiraceae bacterium]